MDNARAAQSGQASVTWLFAYPFRIFFLSLGIWAIVVLALWVPQISGLASWPLALPPLLWHQHEMLFGFLNAAIAGFLLTAVCVWTQTERLQGALLLALWLVWLAGRVVTTFGQELPLWLVHGINLAFLPLVALDAGRRILLARQSRQIPVMVALTLIWLMQAGFLLSGPVPFAAGALVAAMALMLVIGGRITPAFSAAWLRRRGLDAERIRIVPALEWSTLAAIVLLLGVVVLEWTPAVIVLALTAAVLSLTRLLLWRGWLVRADPLLWILHLSLLWIPLALLLLAGAGAGWWPASVWKHAVGAGAMGGLILGVVARVALGHTGRALELPPGMVVAFVLVHLGALGRVLSAGQWLPWQPALWLGGACWILAWAIFLWRYTAILASPRPDGRPG